MASNNNFEILLKIFEKNYDSHAALISKNVDEILTLLPSALRQSGVLFQYPIAKRVKTLTSALAALRRRRDARMERLRLKECFERHQKNWEQYWRDRNKPGRIHDFGEFADCESMLKALRDVGGIRILVFYPSHVEKAIKALKNYVGIRVDRIIERGTTNPRDSYFLKKYVNELEGKQRDDVGIESKISGYRATHLHVSLSDTPEVIVEIQITTVVMNAWSQVEHDIVYKPTMTPSKEEIRILDKFNSIVLVAENAMAQLEGMATQREEACVTFATCSHNLGRWIEIYCAEKRIYPLKGQSQRWSYIELLFDVLQAENQHNSEMIKHLINDLSKTGIDEAVFNPELPLHLTRQLHQVHPNLITTQPTLRSPQSDSALAKFLALRVVQALNMAAYVGIEKELLVIVRKSLSKSGDYPTMTDFLDILHPAYPRVHIKAEEKIIFFCRSFLAVKHIRDFSRDNISTNQTSHALGLIELPMLLLEMNLEAYPKDWPQSNMTDSDETTKSMEVIVPRSLCELLDDPESTHWVPELCSAARDIKVMNEGYGIPFEYPFSGSEAQKIVPVKLPELQSGSSSRKPAPLACISSVGNHRLRVWLGDEQSKEWWDINTHDGHTTHKYCAGKHTSQARQHTGYFRALVQPDFQCPKWEYIKTMPKSWGLKKTKIPLEDTQLNIERYSHPRCELVDLANSIIPVGCLSYIGELDDGAVYYKMNLENAEFCLLSREGEFVLYVGSLQIGS